MASNIPVGVSGGEGLGRRVRQARVRRGMPRDAVAALCGRSEEWLRQIERGKRGTSLKMVTRLAEVLRVPNLTDLLGDDAPTAVYARPEHPSLREIRRAVSSYTAPDTVPPSLDDIGGRLRDAWRVRAVSSHDRSDLAAVLPALIVDVQHAHRAATSPAGRAAAQRLLVEVYHLGQLYLCYQNAPELLWVVVDRAMSAAQEADDPATVGRAVWFSAYLYRDFGVLDEAHRVVEDAVRQLEGISDSPEVARQRCLIRLASAWNYARDGRPAQSWREWDAAAEADRHAAPVPAPYVLFGTTCDDIALTLDVELGRAASASRRAEAVDVDAIGSVPRRTRVMIEAARGQMLKREYAGAVHLLRRAHQTSREATLFSAHARTMVHDLRGVVGPMLRSEVDGLAAKLGLGG